ncbi:MAG TPA: VOC family protein [Candidatus Udaeobacter sp.]|nr:VOC family protein [Candidatus Udaeobacter sp.]
MTTMTRHAAGMFCWTQLGTNDTKAAERFYSGLFGWKFELSPVGERDKIDLITLNGLPIGALVPLAPEQRELGVSWLPFVATDNADATAATVKQAGGKVVQGPMDASTNGRFAVFQDPTRALFAVWQAGSKPGAAVVNEPGTMCWNELITDDANKAGDFYKHVFGWTAEQAPLQQGGFYTIFKKDGAQAAGMMKATPDMKLTHPYWMTYFGVDDVDKSAEKTRQLGGKIMMPPADIPNIGRFSIVTDAQGGYFTLFKPLPSSKS